jgi:micrococcal nuclease
LKNTILPIITILLFLTACGTTEFPTQEDLKDADNQSTAQPIEEENKVDQAEEKQEEEIKEEIPSDRLEVPLIRVVDGDTIKVKINGMEESVRFLLVDTPETSHPRLGKQPFGEQAKSFTKNLLADGTVLLEKDVSERDKYGRLLMYVYTPDGKSVQEELLKAGMARVAYVYAPNTKYVDRYYEIQKEAQKKGVGIWSVENYAQEDGYHTEVMEKEKRENTNITADEFEPDVNGDCAGYIKGNHSSSGDYIYHVPKGNYYLVTKAEICFKTEEAAIEAGFRKSQR